jgi:hypothetical protein
MPDPQPARAYLHKVEAYGVSAGGEPYADVALILPQGGCIRAQAYSSCFGDLNLLSDLVGTEVNLQRSPTGLQLKPIAEQARSDLEVCFDQGRDQALAADGLGRDFDSAFFPSEADPADTTVSPDCCTIPIMQELAATVARLARDLSLPTVMWVHLPGGQDRSSTDRNR